MKGLFITGTGTGVGKTFITATLTKALTDARKNVIALKPFVSGIHENTHWKDNDPLILSEAMEKKYPPEVVSQVRLKLPLSPFDAARIANTSIDLEAVVNAVKTLAEMATIPPTDNKHTNAHSESPQKPFCIIEGAGGVEVPITEESAMGDFIAMISVPALVVARTDLGTINHTVMTVNALRARHIPVAGVIFVDHRPVNPNSEFDLDCIVGPETATRISRVANFGTVPYLKNLELECSPGISSYLKNLPTTHDAINKIITALDLS